MKEVKIRLYQFSELSEKAQRNAIEKLSDINVDYSDWDNSTEDANEIGLKIISLDDHRENEGHFVCSAYETANLIKVNHGETCETYKTAISFISEWDKTVERFSDGVNKNQVTEENEGEFDSIADELEKDFLHSLLEDYRILRNKNYEYLTSEGVIKETIEANEYLFFANGKLANCTTYTGQHEKAGTTELNFHGEIYDLEN